MPGLPSFQPADTWGSQLNAAIESLHREGTHTARDAVASSDLVLNTLWHCTTHDLIYRWNGSSWITYSPSGNKDRLWTPGSGVTSIDEFNDASLDSNWVRVDSAGASRAVWTEDADVLSVANAGGDANSELHALMRPLTSAGGAMAAGDAFITCASVFGSRYVNYTMSGFVLADGVTYGAGTQLVNLSYIGTAGQQNDLRPFTGYNTQPASPAISNTVVTSQQHGTYLRLVMLAANSWRLDCSPDGVSWIKGATYARTVTPTHIGFHCSSWGTSTKGVTTYQFLRRASGVS